MANSWGKTAVVVCAVGLLAGCGPIQNAAKKTAAAQEKKQNTKPSKVSYPDSHIEGMEEVYRLADALREAEAARDRVDEAVSNLKRSESKTNRLFLS